MALFNTPLSILTSGMLWTLLPVGFLLFVVTRSIYNIFFHPLHRIPGPFYAKCSSLWLSYHIYIGDQLSLVHKLHETYGPIVQIAPNFIDISKNDAIGPLYIDGGGFDKSNYYRIFDLNGQPTIFSALSLAERAKRSKAILPLFSTAAVREVTGMISECAQSMTDRMTTAAKTGRPVDLVNLARAFAFDAVSANILQQKYGCLEEKSVEVSISPFIDFIVELGKFYFVSRSLILGLEWLYYWLPQDHKTMNSIKDMDLFLESCVEKAKAGENSYPGRLLANDTPLDQTTAECKDVAFAGTDSTGSVLARICWYLVAKPEKYERLRSEVNESTVDGFELHNVPYLNGFVKEGLRLSMAASSNLPRCVPPRGWNYAGYYIPAKTNVGVSAFELHLDPAVFPDPHEFLPERWLHPTSEMNTSFAPFGKGSRSCVARTLATTEILIATEAIVRADVLRGAERVQEKIEIYEWFNSKFKSGKLELVWPNEIS